ncbi:MAG TPA: regulatory iron-sulfur-containing complex subunit RicT [Phycisphaerae bacterium]|nr:regulatory iron-sulfur-containing complex subunit RicT [Phycisphaerae bacterium]
MVSNILPNGDEPGAAGDAGGACGSDEPCGSGLEKVYPTTAVRYGLMRYIGEFNYPPDMKFGCEVKVVVQTKRGIEIGEQVSLTCQGCSQSVSREQILEFTARSGSAYYELKSGKILRQATPDDLAEYEHINAGAKAKRDLCHEMAQQHKLEIKVVACEPLFGGERIIFYFVADARVDFRALVKDLAREFQTRIEMRQVGTRDEARLVADYETCGRECCCRTFLKSLKPVSMKMAKLQKATLDPSKVSGRCGRLKCCLRYEHTGYEELDARLPRIGAAVGTTFGNATVVDRQILTQLLMVEAEGGGRVAIAFEDVLAPDEAARTGKGPEPRPPKTENGRPLKSAPRPARDAQDRGRGRRGIRGGRAPQRSDSRTPDAVAAKPEASPGTDPMPGEQAGGAVETTPETDSAAVPAVNGQPAPPDAGREAPAGNASADREGGSRRRRRRRRPRGRRPSGSSDTDRGAEGSKGPETDARQGPEGDSTSGDGTT